MLRGAIRHGSTSGFRCGFGTPRSALVDSRCSWRLSWASIPFGRRPLSRWLTPASIGPTDPRFAPHFERERTETVRDHRAPKPALTSPAATQAALGRPAQDAVQGNSSVESGSSTERRRSLSAAHQLQQPFSLGLVVRGRLQADEDVEVSRRQTISMPSTCGPVSPSARCRAGTPWRDCAVCRRRQASSRGRRHAIHRAQLNHVRVIEMCSDDSPCSTPIRRDWLPKFAVTAHARIRPNSQQSARWQGACGSHPGSQMPDPEANPGDTVADDPEECLDRTTDDPARPRTVGRNLRIRRLGVRVPPGAPVSLLSDPDHPERVSGETGCSGRLTAPLRASPSFEHDAGRVRGEAPPQQLGSRWPGTGVRPPGRPQPPGLDDGRPDRDPVSTSRPSSGVGCQGRARPSGQFATGSRTNADSG